MQNYDLIFEKTIRSFNGEKPRLLLHACCAPCSSSVLERVTPHFLVTVYFYNPNITDGEEYEKRLNELRRLISTVYKDTVSVIDGGFCPENFYGYSAGLEEEPERGRRCTLCYADRLKATAAAAKNGGYDYFCTTLSVSPYKDAERINSLGGALAKEYGVQFLFSDFKKKNGYLRSIELSEEYGLYRQNYCGCEYSKQ